MLFRSDAQAAVVVAVDEEAERLPVAAQHALDDDGVGGGHHALITYHRPANVTRPEMTDGPGHLSPRPIAALHVIAPGRAQQPLAEERTRPLRRASSSVAK